MLDWLAPGIRRAVVTVAISTGRRRAMRLATPVRTRTRVRRGLPGGRSNDRRCSSCWCWCFSRVRRSALFANGGYLERIEAWRPGAKPRTSKRRDRQLARVHVRLRREVDALACDSIARERLAREELGYTRRGEMLFLLAEPPESPEKTTP